MIVALALFLGLLSDPTIRLAVMAAAGAVFLAGFGMVFFMRGRRALQDLMAGTYVIEAREYLADEG
jgi:hypothetical protein